SQTQDDKKDYSKMNLDELKSAQDEKKNEINSQSQKINSTITQNEQNVAQAKEAYDSAVAQDNIDPELLQSRENNLNAITQNETQINELNKNINNFDTQITSCDSQLSAIESNIVALNSALGSLSSAPADDPELQAQIAAKREAINGQITALTAQQNELKATKAQLEQQKQQAQSSLDEATSKMQELESEKQTIDENILATCNEQTKQTLEAYNKAREAANTALKAEQDAMNTKKQELASIEQHLNAKNAKQIENQYGYKEKADTFGDTGGYWWDDTDTSTNMKYGVITPNNVDPNEKLPVILYLHGAGSMGNLQRVENGFFNETFADYQMENFNGYIICPSLNRGSWEHESVATDLDEILNSFSKTHNIDPNNIVIAGHSLGGSGVLYMTQQERFKDDDGFKFKKAAVLTGYPDGKEYTDFDMPVGLWVDHGSYKGLDRYVGKYLDYENGDIRVDYTKVRHDKVDNTAFAQDSDGDGRADLIEWLFDED
ncbi:MAG: hypothetical protein IJW73_00500, partial [Candidatus Gastranaerophilales bacterium]|nr:hypothetical protein [Candidatus Gastranaerophilales bacterium]